MLGEGVANALDPLARLWACAEATEEPASPVLHRGALAKPRSVSGLRTAAPVRMADRTEAGRKACPASYCVGTG